MTTSYEPPRVTFVGSDPKLPALRAAIKRVAVRIHGPLTVNGNGAVVAPWNLPARNRFVGLWQARNRRTRVLMFKVRKANDVSG